MEEKVHLTKSEYQISELLAKRKGQVFSREQIYELVFGFDGIGDASAISEHIKNIRAKFQNMIKIQLKQYGGSDINGIKIKRSIS